MPAGSGDRWPEDYERGRPGWPAEVVHVAGLPPNATVLDLGAGTGKLTRELVQVFERVIAVEPAEPTRRLFKELCPRAALMAGTGQDIPLADDSVDGVFAAQAFHWFNDEQSLAGIARVLRPGGALVLMWNEPGGPTEPSIDDVEDLLREHLPKGPFDYDPLDLGGPQYAAGRWRKVFDGAPFSPLREARLPNPQTLDPDGLVSFFASMSWLADLPNDERIPLLHRVRRLLAANTYLRRWETHVHWTRSIER
jgi:SAM-dependent methyltransferase